MLRLMNCLDTDRSNEPPEPLSAKDQREAADFIEVFGLPLVGHFSISRSYLGVFKEIFDMQAHVGRAQLYRLSFVDAHTVAQIQYTGKNFTMFKFFCHGIVLCAKV